MGRQNIYTLPSVSSIVNTSMLSTLTAFMVQHRSMVVDSATRVDLFKTRFSAHSPITEIFRKIQSTGKDEEYSLLLLPQKSQSLPEVVDFTFLPFDMLQIADTVPAITKTLSVIPELNNRMIINITDITKANGEFSDISQFQARVVRDFLARSYYTSSTGTWFSTTLVSYVAKVYSMTIGGQLARLYGLSPLLQSFIQTVFCLFYVGKMTKPEYASQYVKTHAKDLGLFDQLQITQINEFIEDTLGKPCPDSLEDVFAVIDAYGHAQLQTPHGSRLNRPILNMRFASLGSESHVSAMALEYPPYFLFLILQVLSNARVGLSFSMKNHNLLREGRDIVDGLLKSPNLTAMM